MLRAVLVTQACCPHPATGRARYTLAADCGEPQAQGLVAWALGLRLWAHVLPPVSARGWELHHHSPWAGGTEGKQQSLLQTAEELPGLRTGGLFSVAQEVKVLAWELGTAFRARKTSPVEPNHSPALNV